MLLVLTRASYWRPATDGEGGRVSCKSAASAKPDLDCRVATARCTQDIRSSSADPEGQQKTQEALFEEQRQHNRQYMRGWRAIPSTRRMNATTTKQFSARGARKQWGACSPSAQVRRCYVHDNSGEITQGGGSWREYSTRLATCLVRAAPARGRVLPCAAALDSAGGAPIRPPAADRHPGTGH